MLNNEISLDQCLDKIKSILYSTFILPNFVLFLGLPFGSASQSCVFCQSEKLATAEKKVSKKKSNECG